MWVFFGGGLDKGDLKRGFILILARQQLNESSLSPTEAKSSPQLTIVSVHSFSISLERRVFNNAAP